MQPEARKPPLGIRLLSLFGLLFLAPLLLFWLAIGLKGIGLDAFERGALRPFSHALYALLEALPGAVWGPMFGLLVYGWFPPLGLAFVAAISDIAWSLWRGKRWAWGLVQPMWILGLAFTFLEAAGHYVWREFAAFAVEVAWIALSVAVLAYLWQPGVRAYFAQSA